MSSGPSFEKSNVEEKTEQNILQEGFSMSSTNQETLHINVSTLLFLKKKKSMSLLMVLNLFKRLSGQEREEMWSVVDETASDEVDIHKAVEICVA